MAHVRADIQRRGVDPNAAARAARGCKLVTSADDYLLKVSHVLERVAKVAVTDPERLIAFAARLDSDSDGERALCPCCWKLQPHTFCSYGSDSPVCRSTCANSLWLCAAVLGTHRRWKLTPRAAPDRRVSSLQPTIQAAGDVPRNTSNEASGLASVRVHVPEQRVPCSRHRRSRGRRCRGASTTRWLWLPRWCNHRSRGRRGWCCRSGCARR